MMPAGSGVAPWKHPPAPPPRVTVCTVRPELLYQRNKLAASVVNWLNPVADRFFVCKTPPHLLGVNESFPKALRPRSGRKSFQ